MRATTAKRVKAPDDDQPAEIDQAGRWKCDLCKWQNEEVEPICRGCLRGFHYDVLSATRCFLAVLQPSGAITALREMRTRGATDAEILQLVIEKLPTEGHATTEEAPVCWGLDIGPNRIRLGVWFGSLSAVNNNPEQGPDWTDAEVVSELREAFRIPQPAAAIPPAANSKAKPERPSLKKPAAKPPVTGRELDEIPATAELDVNPNEIEVSALNPRIHFDPVKLEEMADSLKKHGQLQNLVVYRRADGKLELIGGERRLRGAKLAKLQTIRVKVLNVTEEEAVELRGIENLIREDLTSIETGRWYQQMIDRCGYTQEALAERLGISQPTIANRLRLLRLPDEWQQRVISREINEGQARVLVPWCDLPPLLKKVADKLEDNGECTVKEFTDWVEDALHSLSRPLKPGVHFHYSVKTKAGASYRQGQVRITPKDLEAARAELDVRDVPSTDWNGRADYEPRAFNLDAWEKVQTAAAARYEATQSKRIEKTGNAKPTDSPADQKRKAAEAKKKSEARVYHWRTRWYQQQIGDRLADAKLEQICRCLLYFAVGEKPGRRMDELVAVIKAFGGSTPRKFNGRFTGHDVWNGMKNIPAGEINNLVNAVVAEWWRHDTESWSGDVSPNDIEAFAAELGVALEEHWRVDRTFLELFTKDQLHDLASEWAITSHKKWIASKKDKRGEVIEALLVVDESLTGQKKRLPAPKVLLKAKGD